MSRPILAITCGDPAGIGPELACRAAAASELLAVCTPLLIGDPGQLAATAEACGLPRPQQVLATKLRLGSDFVPGRVQANAGRIALEAVDLALAGCRSGHYAAMLTGPANKQALAAAGCRHPGHTEYLAEACGVAEVGMLLTGGGMAVLPVTIHQPLATVPASLSSARIVSQTRLLHRALRRLLGREPRLAVLGLNPHAGDGGLLGSEDQAIVAPAVQVLRQAGIQAEGPCSPDAAFTPAARARYDGHVCLYHDQGLIVFKALAVYEGVNATLGLPIVRTAPDHGSAYDIVGQHCADPRSTLAAAALALKLAGM